MDDLHMAWRWVDGEGRPMTAWQTGNPPPVLDLEDAKGKMRVEARLVGGEAASMGATPKLKSIRFVEGVFGQEIIAAFDNRWQHAVRVNPPFDSRAIAHALHGLAEDIGSNQCLRSTTSTDPSMGQGVGRQAQERERP